MGLLLSNHRAPKLHSQAPTLHALLLSNHQAPLSPLLFNNMNQHHVSIVGQQPRASTIVSIAAQSPRATTIVSTVSILFTGVKFSRVVPRGVLSYGWVAAAGAS